jgi:hypothetical protein
MKKTDVPINDTSSFSKDDIDDEKEKQDKNKKFMSLEIIGGQVKI